MQTNTEENPATGKTSRPKSSYAQALKQLLNPVFFTEVQMAVHAPLNSICQSTKEGEQENLCFLSDSDDVLECGDDAKLLEDKLGHPAIEVIPKDMYTKDRLDALYKNIMPFVTIESVQNFIQASQTSKKLK